MNNSKSEASENIEIKNDQAKAIVVADSSATNKNQQADMRSILQEVVEAPTAIEHPSSEQYLKLQRLLLQEASTLAKQLFELTNNSRDASLEVYLKTINDVVIARPSFENQFILSKMQSIFTETYGKFIRHLGHNPNVLEQIVHRTGKETRAIVTKTLAGFNATELAEQIRAYALNSPDHASKLTAKLMYDLTHQQIRELRLEYNSLPARELARLLYSFLNRKDLRGRPFPDQTGITYLLQHRPRKELAQIEFQYNELYHFVYDRQREPCLREQIRNCFNEQIARDLLVLLDGFDPGPIADNIYISLNDYTNFIEGLDNLDNIKLGNDFSVLFRRAIDDLPIWQRELRIQPTIEKLVRNLSHPQFEAVLDTLNTKYDINLSPKLYQRVGQFDARQIALDLESSCQVAEACPSFKRDDQYLSDYEIASVKDEFRFSKQADLHDIIKVAATEKRAAEALRRSLKAIDPILMLNREQINEVSKCFLNIFGRDLIDTINDTVSKICRNAKLPYVYETITVLSVGVARQSVKIDIFELFSSKLKREQEAANTLQMSSVYERIPELSSLILAAVNEESSRQDLVNYLLAIPHTELMLLEHICINNRQQPQALLAGLKECLTHETTLNISYILRGIQVDKLVQAIHADPIQAICLLKYNCDDVSFITRRYQELTGVTLLSKLISEPIKDEQLQSLCLLIAFSEQAQALRNLLMNCLNENNQEDLALEILFANKDSIAIFENCYNYYYGNYHPAYQAKHGALLTTLRILVSENKVSRLFFSKALNILEQVDRDITENLYHHVANPEISDELLESLNGWLRTYRADMPVVQKSYNALDPECTLRERIYLFKRSVLEINNTILLYDGYDPELLTFKVRSHIEKFAQVELGNSLCSLLATEHKQQKNILIPTDPNWVQEMYHQVRIRYQQLYGSTIITELVRKGVPLKGQGINTLAHILYGDISLSGLKIFKAINTNTDQVEERLKDIKEAIYKLDPVALQTLTEFYNDYIVAIGKGQGLFEDLEKTFGGTTGYTEVIAIFVNGQKQATENQLL